ncbi:Type IV secretory pathway, VirD4 components [Leuconostoc inhae]|uniref:Type IV secretory pathway, VirD4 components n=2 Tax=Leuconostoc TaxID=1243 RepID=A0AAN2QU31_9LACO|nr:MULTISPECIES: type IV secretory system conjugative DNA transfer family protein [Leuconostoc]MBZ5959096.1 type IV secretory system conjugative DNA transfer family protein [Leuconostoc gasicomitatum]MBZ5981468.1 type IV secretory system conjugative DNA transfer family protein [Leuconostoc gasicomitatum]MBZ5982287.1 type IV secretory system conjugative DNA transfer family protein [Leuconostoc gasicomitatum]CUR63658.1 Conjugation-related ATPase TraG [Leuconostoc gasicomitatum KG16-1]CUW04937.1 
MKLFKKDYRAERQFMRDSFIRWRGRSWFLWLYGILATMIVMVVSLYVTILVDLIIRVAGPYIQAFMFYVQSGVTQWPEFTDLMNMTLTVLNPLNMFLILFRLTLVTGIVLGLVFLLLLKKYVFQRIYDWYQLFRDQTRNTNRFAEVREVDKTYKLIPDRNKNFKGKPGQPVLHTQGYTFEFFMIHPILWAWQWFKRPLGMNSLVFSGLYKKIRPLLLAHLPKLFENQIIVTGGFDGFYWLDTSNTHSKTTGMTRSSKDQMRGYTFIDILRRAEIKWNIIDTDAKNEDAKMSYKSLRSAGYDVKLLNIMNPSESESWNPLQIAMDYAFDGDWDSANTELRQVVQVIGGPGGEETSHKDIWDSAAESTIQAVMLTVLYLAVRHQDKSMVTISNVLQFINDMNKFTDKSGDGLTRYMTNLGKLPRTPARNMIILNAAEYLSATGETKSSISFSVMNRLNLFASESITRLTTFNTINLTDLGFPRMLKMKFSDRYKGVHVSIRVYESGKQKVIEKDKLTVSQSGTLTYPIHNCLPTSWRIELSLDNDGNTNTMRKQSFTLTGKTVQRKLLNGKIKRDKYSQEPVIQCLVDRIKPINATETPGVQLRYSERPMAVFIITPQSNDDFSALASLFISQVFSVNTDIAATITRRKMDNWILYKLNEFSMFPRIPGFTNILTRGLTYGHIVDLYIQTLTQPRLHYSEMETNDINGNTGNWFHILTNDEPTNEALSKQLGEVEVQTESVNSQIGLDRQDRGNRQIQVSKVRLLDAKEISELSPREMITIRTIKRTDKKGRDVRPLPIFSTGAYRMPFAYELLGKQYSLDYYTADLNIKAQHNDLKYDDLYHDFVPYFDELVQQLQLSLEDGESDRNAIDYRSASALTDEAINDILDNSQQNVGSPGMLTNQEISDQERYLNWKENFNPNEPFMTEAQIDNVDLRLIVEKSIKTRIPRSNKTEEQTSANGYLDKGLFLKLPGNNNNATVLRLLNNEPQYMWEIYKQLNAATQQGEVE